jgi:hypothetical protein
VVIVLIILNLKTNIPYYAHMQNYLNLKPDETLHKETKNTVKKSVFKKRKRIRHIEDVKMFTLLVTEFSL